MGEPLVRHTLVSEVTARLREHILGGRFPPGARLHQEDLSEALGVSRTPLRQALGLLVMEGFVVRSETSQYTVAAVDKANLGDLYLVRRELDGLAAKLAAARHTEDDIARLSTALDAMTAADPHEWLREHRAFHVAIYEAAHNEHLMRMTPIVQISTQLYYPQLMAARDRRERSHKEHQSVFDAIVAGDTEVAQNQARQHISAAMDLLQ